jgi:hypothetical protein
VQPNQRVFAGVESAKDGLGDMRALLTRHGQDVRGRSLRCPSPDHLDKHPSASIYIAVDGDQRVHCHSCGLDEDVIGIAGVLGVPVRLSGRRRAVPTSSPLPRLSPRIRHMARDLVERPSWGLEWEVITLLASLPALLARQDVIANWDWLGDRLDIPLMVGMSDALRAIALERYPGRRDAVAVLLAEVRR